MKLLKLLIAFSIVSCGSDPIKFRPDIWVSDYKNGLILNHKLGSISCNEKSFSSFFHFSESDLIEIVNILKNGSMPKSLKSEIFDEIDIMEKSVKKSESMRE